MTETETLAEYIRGLCRLRGLSWRAASLKAGLNRNYITHLIRGRQSLPKADTLKALAKALDGDYEYMLALRDLAPSTTPPKPPFEHRAIVAMQQLPPEDQERVLAMLEGLVAHYRAE